MDGVVVSLLRVFELSNDGTIARIGIILFYNFVPLKGRMLVCVVNNGPNLESRDCRIKRAQRPNL